MCKRRETLRRADGVRSRTVYLISAKTSRIDRDFGHDLALPRPFISSVFTLSSLPSTLAVILVYLRSSTELLAPH